MRFQTFLEWECVMSAVMERYKNKEEIKWQGKRISFFTDVTKDVADRRKKFTEVQRKLHEMDIRFTLAFPAVLQFSWKGKRMSFDDHRKALEFIAKETAHNTE